HQVAVDGVGVGGREGVRGLKLHGAVARRASETVAHLDKGRGGVEGAVDRHGVGTVGRVGGRDRVEGHRHGMTGGRVDSAAVAAAVAATTAAVIVDRGVVEHVELVGGEVAHQR